MPAVIFFECLELEQKSSLINRLINVTPATIISLKWLISSLIIIFMLFVAANNSKIKKCEVIKAHPGATHSYFYSLCIIPNLTY
jgi:hypothetical protein